MFGVSFPELLVIMVIILIVFGPDKLPQAARTFGKLMGDLRRSSDSVRREFYNSVYKPADELKRSISTEAQNLVQIEESKTAAQPKNPSDPTEPIQKTDNT